jgi:negative regulator of flagellin synthesis FlgM
VKIEGNNGLKAVLGPQAGDNRPKAADTAATQGQGGEKVELSSLSASLGKAEAAIAAAPVVDRARVDEIRQAMSEGRFKVDAERIADGLIDSVRQMLGTQADKP